jgi:hypothetical protein
MPEGAQAVQTHITAEEALEKAQGTLDAALAASKTATEARGIATEKRTVHDEARKVARAAQDEARTKESSALVLARDAGERAAAAAALADERAALAETTKTEAASLADQVKVAAADVASATKKASHAKDLLLAGEKQDEEVQARLKVAVTAHEDAKRHIDEAKESSRVRRKEADEAAAAVKTSKGRLGGAGAELMRLRGEARKVDDAAAKLAARVKAAEAEIKTRETTLERADASVKKATEALAVATEASTAATEKAATAGSALGEAKTSQAKKAAAQLAVQMAQEVSEKAEAEEEATKALHDAEAKHAEALTALEDARDALDALEPDKKALEKSRAESDERIRAAEAAEKTATETLARNEKTSDEAISDVRKLEAQIASATKTAADALTIREGVEQVAKKSTTATVDARKRSTELHTGLDNATRRHEDLVARAASTDTRAKELRGQADRLQESARGVAGKASETCATLEKSLCEALISDVPESDEKAPNKGEAAPGPTPAPAKPGAPLSATRRVRKDQDEDTMEVMGGVVQPSNETASPGSVPFKLAVATADGPVSALVFKKDTVVVGRDPKCDVHLDNMLVSRRHAEIRRNEGIFALVDLETQNGTMLNGKRVNGMALLNDGDGIQIGKFRLRFEAETTANPLGKLSRTAIPVGDVGGAGGMTLTMSPETEKRIAEDNTGRARGHVVLARRNAPEVRIFISETFQIGKAPECDLVLKGWFVPRKAAIIARGHDRYTLINVSGAVGAISVNEKPVADTAALGNDDRIEIYGETFKFSLK